jgi:hypothetical protein
MADIETLRQRYIAEFGNEPCTNQVLSDIESVLKVQLPKEFKQISTFYSGGLLGGISHHEIACEGDATNIVRETLRLRSSIGLSGKYVVIAEPPESLIIIDTTGAPAVIWCDAVDAKNINSQEFANQPNTWENYSDFFEYLLDEEEDG